MGVRRDPSFGPVAAVGIGGTTAELLADITLGLAPVDVERAKVMLERLRHAPLLQGFRGSVPVDLDAVASTLAAISRAAVEHPEIAELEVNPVLAHAGGVIALDAAAVLISSP